MSKKHTNFILKESGFVISADHPFIGVSPDCIAKCDCCGQGCVEIICPFGKDTVIEEGLNIKGFCFTKNDLGQTQLLRDHAYYYKFMSITINTNQYMQASHGDFIVWFESNISIERILPDKAFWNRLVEKATAFFKTCRYLNWQENFATNLLALFRTV